MRTRRSISSSASARSASSASPGDPAQAGQAPVDHLGAAFGDRAERQLGLVGQAELADHQHVERRVEHGRDLGGDRHAAAGEGDHQRAVEAERGDRLGQLPAGVPPIGEAGAHADVPSP